MDRAPPTKPVPPRSSTPRPPAPRTVAPTPVPASPPTAVAAAPSAPVFVPASHTAAYLNNPPPPYPLWARRAGIEGRVLLTVQVGADGRPTTARVSETSGNARLDEIARSAVLGWRFEPARRNGRPTAAAVTVPITFSLR